jgi:hypothetical protein
MTLIQILIIAFAIFALTRAVRQFKKGSFSIAWLIFWILFWACAAVVAFLPQTTDVVARLVGVGRGADMIVYLSLIALFYLVFRIYVKIEQVEGEITRLVRGRALDDAQDEFTKK